MDQIRPSRTERNAALILTLAVLLWLAGCASMPEPIRGAPAQSAEPGQARTAPEQYKGATVRWGGVIAAVTNRPDESLVEIVSRPLSSSGRPEDTDATAGRFLARIAGFIDPVVYAVGRELTVVGTIEGEDKRKIGEYAYTYPVVKTTGHYLWPQRLPPVRDPFYYAPYHRWPYYDPWYPYGPYPYW